MTQAAELAGYASNLQMFRNKIINGGMQVNQRGNSTSVSTTSYRACDRYHFVITNGGTWSISQSTDAPEGFGNSYKLECTTARSGLANDSRLLIIHKIEGQNLQDLKKGTAGAESVTLSFYVKTSLAGTYQVNLEDNDNIRIIGNTYTISSSEVNTWQYKTFTFAGDTTGVLDNDNMDSLALHFVLVAGDDNSTGSLPTAWEAKSNTDRGAGLTVNLAATVGNTWQIAGVQLEIGTVATPFEHRPIGMELNLCKRYYEKSSKSYRVDRATSQSSTYAVSFFYEVEKRAIPLVITTAQGGTTGQARANGVPFNVTQDTGAATTRFFSIYFNGVLSVTSGNAVTTDCSWSADAEL